jgi:hypothetical protein
MTQLPADAWAAVSPAFWAACRASLPVIALVGFGFVVFLLKGDNRER